MVGILLGIFLLFRFLTGATRRRESTPIDLGPMDSRPLSMPETELELPEYPLLGAGNDPTAPLPLEAAAEVPEYARMRATIDRLSGSDPKRTAEYLRALMDEKQPV